MSGIKALDSYPDISFIDNMSIEDIQEFYLNKMQEKYTEVTGEKLMMHEADPLRLIAWANCMMLYQIAQYADRAGKMSLLKYSYGDFLDNLGACKNTTRITGAAARTRLKFSLSSARASATVVPAGTRVTGGDGVYFLTTDTMEIPAGQTEGEVNAECRDEGIRGNGYLPGEINIIVDPVAYVKSVRNMTETTGGADRETDENLTERIYLAPSSYSCAGPDDAYKFWAKTCNPGITDTFVSSPSPGVVDIRFIMQGGELPEKDIIEEVDSYLHNEKIRPVTDQVRVGAPDAVLYKIDFSYYINESDRVQASTIQGKIEAAVKKYVLWQREKIGRDLNPDQLCSMVISAGAKRVEMRSPEYRRITPTGLAIVDGEPSVLYGGVEDD